MSVAVEALRQTDRLDVRPAHHDGLVGILKRRVFGEEEAHLALGVERIYSAMPLVAP